MVAIAVAGIVLAAIFQQLSLLVFGLIGFALATYLAIRIGLYDLG